VVQNKQQIIRNKSAININSDSSKIIVLLSNDFKNLQELYTEIIHGKNDYGYHEKKAPINICFDYKNYNMIVITIRLVYLKDYGCKDMFILWLSEPNILFGGNYHYYRL